MRRLARLNPAAGCGKPFDWKHNAQRHSFISYRVAAVKNIAEMSLEAGNSPQIIFEHCRKLVRLKASVRFELSWMDKFVAKQ